VGRPLRVVIRANRCLGAPSLEEYSKILQAPWGVSPQTAEPTDRVSSLMGCLARKVGFVVNLSPVRTVGCALSQPDGPHRKLPLMGTFGPCTVSLPAHRDRHHAELTPESPSRPAARTHVTT
jgi:hypothetical protein